MSAPPPRDPASPTLVGRMDNLGPFDDAHASLPAGDLSSGVERRNSIGSFDSSLPPSPRRDSTAAEEAAPRPSGATNKARKIKKAGPWIPDSSDVVRAYGDNPFGDYRPEPDSDDESDTDQPDPAAHSACACGVKNGTLEFHKAECAIITSYKEKLQTESTKLDAFMRESSDPVDFYWAVLEGYDYLKVRFNLAVALSKVDTDLAVSEATSQFQVLLMRGGFDKLGVRDYIPHLLLRARWDSSCYEFIKTCGNETFTGYDTILFQNWMQFPWDSTINFGNQTPNVFKPVGDFFQQSGPSLSHLVALAFLKVSLWLDMRALELGELSHKLGGDGRLRRRVKEVSKNKYVENRTHCTDIAGQLAAEFKNLFQRVNAANPFFWKTLITALESGTFNEPETFAEFCVHHPQGSQGEADRVVMQSVWTWMRDPEAVQAMRDAIRAYPPSTSALLSDAQETTCINDRPITTNISGRVIPERYYPRVPRPPVEGIPDHPIDYLTFVSQHEVYRPVFVEEGQVVCITAGICQEEVASWAVTVKLPTTDKVKLISSRLEDRGPAGDLHVASTIRAELRAALAALRMVDYQSKGIKQVIIATESEYVVFGAAVWVRNWLDNKPAWTKDIGGPVENQDLWMALLGDIERLFVEAGVTVRV